MPATVGSCGSLLFPPHRLTRLVACLLLVLFIVLGWRYYQKGKGKTICGKPRVREGGARDEEKG